MSNDGTLVAGSSGTVFLENARAPANPQAKARAAAQTAQRDAALEAQREAARQAQIKQNLRTASVGLTPTKKEQAQKEALLRAAEINSAITNSSRLLSEFEAGLVQKRQQQVRALNRAAGALNARKGASVDPSLLSTGQTIAAQSIKKEIGKKEAILGNARAVVDNVTPTAGSLFKKGV